MNVSNPFEQITDRLLRIEQALMLLRADHPPEVNQNSDIPLSIQEAAKIIGKSVPTVYGYVHRGILPHMKRGQRLYFYRSELISWIEAGRVKTNDEIKQAAVKSLER